MKRHCISYPASLALAAVYLASVVTWPFGSPLLELLLPVLADPAELESPL